MPSGLGARPAGEFRDRGNRHRRKVAPVGEQGIDHRLALLRLGRAGRIDQQPAGQRASRRRVADHRGLLLGQRGNVGIADAMEHVRMAAEDAGRRARRVEQDRLDRRGRRPVEQIGRDEIGGQPGPRQIGGQHFESSRREVERGDLPAGGGKLHRLAAGRGAKVEHPAALAAAKQPGRDRRGQILHPPKALGIARQASRHRNRAARGHDPGSRLTPFRRSAQISVSAGSFEGQVERRRRAAAPVPPPPPRRRPRRPANAPRPVRAGVAPPAAARRAATRCRTRHAPAAWGRPRRAAVRSRSPRDRAFRGPATEPGRGAGQTAPSRQREAAGPSRNR